MDVGHFYSPTTDLYRDQIWQQKSIKPKPKSKSAAKVRASAKPGDTGEAMVDNKGWRMKIGGGKLKDLPPLKTEFEDTVAALPVEAASEPNGRPRRGWRKTIAASRPLTPITPASTTPTPDSLEDIRGEQTKASAPRHNPKPKLTRYTSLFSTHKEEPTSPIFSEPWSIDSLPDQEDSWSYVDPINIIESIHSHMCKNYMVPIPVQYTSGLFQIFDDYRKLRSQKEILETREREAHQQSRETTARCLESQEKYESEIRRLELFIVRGMNGMTGVMQARQGTVVDRKRQHRRTISTDSILPRYQRMSSVELDERIKEIAQQVLLHRPVSPSGRMIALSQQLTSVGVPELPIGTPPSTSLGSALSRKVKSELNLLDLRAMPASQRCPGADIASEPEIYRDESQTVTTEADQLSKHVLECDAFAALQELGALVARRRGLHVASFVSGLMGLLASTDSTDTTSTAVGSNGGNTTQSCVAEGHTQVSANDRTPRLPLRKARSQSYPEIDQKQQRHFSFDSGDDQMRELAINIRAADRLSQSNSSDSDLSSSAHFELFDDGLPTSDDENPVHLSLEADMPKPSMIPSPVQTSGRVRPENSISSLQSVFSKNSHDVRHNSRTSVQTAFREATSIDIATDSQSRSGSHHNLGAAELPLGSKNRPKSGTNRQSTAALAAARAIESRSNNASRSNTQLSATITAFHKRNVTVHRRTENTDLVKCKHADE